MSEQQQGQRQRARGKVTRQAGPPSDDVDTTQNQSHPAQDVSPQVSPSDSSSEQSGSSRDSGHGSSESSSDSRGSGSRRSSRGSRGGRGGRSASNGNNGGGGKNSNGRSSGNGGTHGNGGNGAKNSGKNGGRSGGRSGRGGNGGNGSRANGRGAGGGAGYKQAPHGGFLTMQGTDLSKPLPAPPKAPKNGLRIVALGGISEIGRNMTVFEYGGKLLIIDCGVLFPSSTEPGVDLILPDFSWIEDRLADVEALVLTHGHEDHIGAIPFLLKLRPDIPIVGSRFTNALVAAKCQEHRLRPKFITVDEASEQSFGRFTVNFFAVNHSIPDALGIVLKTPAGVVMHTGDIKLDPLPTDRRPTDLAAMARYGDDGVDVLLMDSTNATTPGVSPSESEIGSSLRRLIGNVNQRVIVACFASNVYRVQAIVDAAVANRRKVFLVGRSMVRNMGIAQELGFLDAPEGTFIDQEQAAKLPPEKVVVVTTGTQGETMAGLSRMSRGEHRQISIRNGDLVILSSSLVPGNEEAVFGVINNLAQIGAEVVTSKDAKVHVSGHGYSGELLYVYNIVRPSNVMPVHGEWRHLRANKDLAVATGVDPERVVLAQNGVVVDMINGRIAAAGQVPVGQLYVDGLTTGDISEEVLSDRTALGEDGFIAATVVVDHATGRPVGKPQVQGKGFTDDPGALDDVPALVENAVMDLAGQGENDPYRVAQVIRRVISRWVSQKWRRNPMVVPTVVTAGEEASNS